MAFVLSDRVKETSTTTGSGSITLNGATGPFQTFNNGIGNGNSTYYTIENFSRWEVGLGTYTSSSNSLSRDFIFDSSAGGSKINLQGVSVVFCTLPADKSLVKDIQDTVNLSGIYFTDGTFQNSASQGTQDITAVSGMVVSVSGMANASGNYLLELINSGIFNNDLIVSLSNGKTFGKYSSGDVIPASGKTPTQVIQMAIVEPIAPTTSFSSSSTVGFNQTNINNILNFSYTINSLGASVSSVVLEWRRNNTGSWTTLSTSQSTPSSFTHTMTDTNFNTQVFNYRYTVTDTVGGTTQKTLNITPSAYVNPSISLTVAAVSATSPETNSNRERGNVNSNLSGSVTRNSPNVNLVNYTLQFQINGGSWSDIGSAVNIGPGNSSISSTNHNPTAFASTAISIGYRVKVVDDYLQSIGSQVYSSVSTVNLNYLIFYGPSSSTPTDSAGVRALASRQFINGSNPFDLNTGSTLKIFTVAMPSTSTISSVVDLDALNADITSGYINSVFNVNDAGGTATSYNVYTMNNAIPYSSNHRHRITRT